MSTQEQGHMDKGGPARGEWAHLDSNQGLTGYEPATLPLSYRPEQESPLGQGRKASVQGEE